VNYVNNYDLAESLYLYGKHNKYRYEKKFYNYIQIMIDEIIREGKFSGYTNLRDDMKSNALYFIAINLKRGNIKVKKLKNGKTCYIKTKLALKRKQNIVEEKNIDTILLDDILGTEVIIKKRISNNKVIVSKVTSKEKLNARYSKIEYEDKEYEIDIFTIAFSNIFSYITYIIEQSFWKVINEENFQRNKTQLLYNTASRVQTDEIKVELDFTNETNKEKIEKMRIEAIKYEQKKTDEANGIIIKRKKSRKLAKNNIYGYIKN